MNKNSFEDSTVTAQNAAIIRAEEIRNEIHELQKELEKVLDREWKYRGCDTLESDRLKEEKILSAR